MLATLIDFFVNVVAISGWLKTQCQCFTLCVEASISIITATSAEISNKPYSHNCFLNIIVPREVANNKTLSMSYMKSTQGKLHYKNFKMHTWRTMDSHTQKRSSMA